MLSSQAFGSTTSGSVPGSAIIALLLLLLLSVNRDDVVVAAVEALALSIFIDVVPILFSASLLLLILLCWLEDWMSFKEEEDVFISIVLCS